MPKVQRDPNIAFIVGMHFRPPAKAVLACLPADTPLTLRREPDNAFDTNAIKVEIDPCEMPRDEHQHFALLCDGMGRDPDEDFHDQTNFHLGYIHAPKAKVLAEDAWLEATAFLDFDINGEPFAKDIEGATNDDD